MKKDVHVALLRGINVGGHNPLPMKHLVDIVDKLNVIDAKTYIQSGNVVYRCPATVSASKLGPNIAKEIRSQHKLQVAVLTLSAVKLEKIVKQNPFVNVASAARLDQGKTLHVGFLSSLPSARTIQLLDVNRSPGDRFKVNGSVVYILAAQGLGKTKLTTTWFEKCLGTKMTVRNWNTVQRLLEMAANL